MESPSIEAKDGSQLSLILVKAGIATFEGIPRVSHTPTGIQNRFKPAVQSSA